MTDLSILKQNDIFFHFVHGYRNWVVGCFYVADWQPAHHAHQAINTTWFLVLGISRHKWLKSDQQQGYGNASHVPLDKWDARERSETRWQWQKSTETLDPSGGCKSRRQGSGVMQPEEKKKESEKEANPPFIFRTTHISKKRWYFCLVSLERARVKE